MTDARHIEAQIYERLSKVIDPELGRSITDLGMIAAINAVGVTSQAVFFRTQLIGPSDEKMVLSPPSYPYIVVKTEYRKESVIFE